MRGCAAAVIVEESSKKQHTAGQRKTKSHGLQPTATKEALLPDRHGQTAFAGKTALEIEGGAAIFSLQQRGSPCVRALVMSCRGSCELPGPQVATLPYRAGTINPPPALLLSLTHNGAEYSLPTASRSSTSPSSWGQGASLGLVQQSLLQCRTGQLPKPTPVMSFSS